jgi:hypothetical protein
MKSYSAFYLATVMVIGAQEMFGKDFWALLYCWLAGRTHLENMTATVTK